MPDLNSLLQHGAANLWVFIPTAVMLGALHGLEPGHSKTMMAAFIIAIRGTIGQAVLLGLAATASHTAVVWGVALVGMRLGSHFNAETTEPYFQVASGILIIIVALWMLARTYREHLKEMREEGHSHDHDHDHHHHHHHHDDETRRIDTGHGLVAELQIMEEGMPPRFRLSFSSRGKPLAPPADQVYQIETTRPDGTRQSFALAGKGMFLESVDEIPEPHEFIARLSMAHGDHSHEYDVEFAGHSHAHPGLDLGQVGYQDAHELAHANDIKRRFANGNATTAQIIMFGLTGGLIPCPAAITVLLLCLQLKKFTMGMTLVLCFSVGLAITMVAAGAVAAISVRQVSRRMGSRFGNLARRAPYFSSALIICMGIYILIQGLRALK